MAYKAYVQTVTPTSSVLWANVDAPDTTGKYADDKFKITIEFGEDVIFDTLKSACKDVIRKNKVEVPFDQVILPYRFNAETKTYRIVAKSRTQPSVIDTLCNVINNLQEFPRRGDLVKVSVALGVYPRVEKVREGGKLVTLNTVGINAYLNAVQIIEKSSGGGKAVDMFKIETGFVATQSEPETLSDDKEAFLKTIAVDTFDDEINY